MRRGRWIAICDPDDRRTHEIARTVKPLAALAPSPRGLAERDEPIPFCNALSLLEPREKIRIGRTCFLDDLDQTGCP